MLLVDDHMLVREGIRAILQNVQGIKVIGEAETGERAVVLAKELVPDVVIIDMDMPGIGGLAATKKMIHHNPGIKVLALTIYEEEPYPSRFLKAGASGYITKGCPPDEMVRAIRTLHTGQHYIAPKIAQEIAVKRYAKGEESPFEILSEREMEIVRMITQAKKAQEIAETLCLSPKTVNSYRYRIFEKLNIESDVELILMAVRFGLIDVSQKIEKE